MTMLRIMKTGAVFALFLGASVAAHAAGLGKLSVQSALGQLLVAEIDLVSLQPGELDSLTARVASPEAYRDAKIEYSGVLRLLRFTVEKRANGQAYLKMTSVAPLNEPFVDLLIEVTWPAGRLQREYPILLDPPGFAEARSAPAVTAPAPTAKVEPAPAPPPEPVAAPSVTPAAAPVAAGSPSARTELAASKGDTKPEPSGDSYGPVKKGETLRKIAGEVKPSTVSMEQMLSALYRENKGAFIDNNMNRLKAGQILRVPTADETGKISDKEANQEIRAHVTNWKTYRDQLAGGVAAMPTRPESSQAAVGKVASAAVTPPPTPTPDAKDVLKLSKSDAGKSGTGSKAAAASQDRINALQEEVTSKDKALKEAQSRVSDLEKQIQDMQRLASLKAGATKSAETPKAVEAPKVAVVTPEPAKPVEAPKPAEPPKAIEPPKVTEAPKPAEAKPDEAPKPTEAPKVAEAPKPAAPKKAPPAPVVEKGFMDELMENPAYIAVGAGGIGALALGGFLFARRRKSRAGAGPLTSMTSAFPSDLKPNTVTGKSGGGLVDTGNSSFLTDFDKTGPGTIDTDEVDPVAEAEVYIAYGRDAQAEEILKEAMARDKGRHEIALKLLEIYHARKSATAFETVAKELHASIGESHPLWQKAAAMGAQIDPTNPLYVAAASGTSTFNAMQTVQVQAKPNLDFDLDSSSSAAAAAAAESSHASTSSFDLDLGSEKNAPAHEPEPAPHAGLDFDLAPSAPAGTSMDATTHQSTDEKPSFDFDLSGLEMPSGKAAAAQAPADLPLSFEPSPAASHASSMSLTDLNLDSGGGGGEAVGTKLELAKAYLEIGDKDGAREILQEVVKEGSAAQRDEAQKLIASL
jgi:pilus assembly protein FimV